jgi:hypothetical protein
MPTYKLCTVSGWDELTTRSPNAGEGGANSTLLTLPFAPVKIPFSIHRPSLFPALLVEADGSSHTLTVRSWEQEAIREPCNGCAKAKRSKGAS